MSTNSGKGLVVVAGLYLAAGAALYGTGLAASPCRENVSVTNSLFWGAQFLHEVVGGSTSFKDFVLSSDCRDPCAKHPGKCEELLRQARGQR